MRECKKLQDSVALYASGDLDAKDRSTVEAHLQSCSECRRAVDEMRALVAVASAEPVRVPDELAGRIAEQVNRQRAVAPPPSAFKWSTAFAFAAAVAVVFGAGVLVGIRLPGGEAPAGEAVVVSSPTAGGGHRAHVAARMQRDEPPERTQEVAAEPDESAPTAVAADSAEPTSPPAAGRAARRVVRHVYRAPGAVAPAHEAPAVSEPQEQRKPPAVKAPLPAGVDDVRLAAIPEGDLEW
ncbi:MAG: zf-HC2 domain-containing protein [Armatimonadota bacterium]|nr:MAG: zf-HC2 domain-containing protein [Armatimonadota bacterium]